MWHYRQRKTSFFFFAIAAVFYVIEATIERNIYEGGTWCDSFSSFSPALVQKDKDLTTLMGEQKIEKNKLEEAADACQRSKRLTGWFFFLLFLDITLKFSFRCIR